jgi:hypothetical protein
VIVNGGAKRYEIVVRGRLSDRSAAAFEGSTLRSRPGETTLTGELTDQAQLYGLINRLRDLGIELISVRADAGAPAPGELGQGVR